MNQAIEILSTRELDPALVEMAGDRGIRIEISPFIRTEAVESVEVQQEIELLETMHASVVFSSSNAVEAVAACTSQNIPAWNMYCVGNSTAQRAASCFPYSRVCEKADSAAELAEKIMEDGDVEEIFFFCGDQRRDEMPDMLREAGLVVNEIAVYQTIAVPHRVKKDFAGILFFSPSGVKSFFAVNKLPPDIPLFAIGNTTATTIRNLCSNPVIMPDHPSREGLVEELIAYYN